MELGPESPAVVGFVACRWKVTTTSIAATLVDLAARGHRRSTRSATAVSRPRPESCARSAAGLRAAGDAARARPRRQRNGAGDGTVPWLRKHVGQVVEGVRTECYRPRGANWAWLGAGSRSSRARCSARTFRVSQCSRSVSPGEIWGTVQREQGEDFDAGSGLIMAGVAWLFILGFGALRVAGVARDTGGFRRCRGLARRAQLSRPRRRIPRVHRPPASSSGSDCCRTESRSGSRTAPRRRCRSVRRGNDEGWSPQRGLWRQVRIEYPKRFRYGEAPKRAAAVSALALVLVALGPVSRAWVRPGRGRRGR